MLQSGSGQFWKKLHSITGPFALAEHLDSESAMRPVVTKHCHVSANTFCPPRKSTEKHQQNTKGENVPRVRPWKYKPHPPRVPELIYNKEKYNPSTVWDKQLNILDQQLLAALAAFFQLPAQNYRSHHFPNISCAIQSIMYTSSRLSQSKIFPFSRDSLHLIWTVQHSSIS